MTNNKATLCQRRSGFRVVVVGFWTTSRADASAQYGIGRLTRLTVGGGYWRSQNI